MCIERKILPTLQNVLTLNAREISKCEFWKHYCDTPILLLNACGDWILDSWGVEDYLNHFGDELIRYDNEGGMMRLCQYLYYLDHNDHDTPLYLFDYDFLNDKRSYYSQPFLFRDVNIIPDIEGRPHYSWILIGGEKSGSAMHVDPMSTSAWNYSLIGKKRWICIPPDVTLSHSGYEQDALDWITNIYPSLSRETQYKCFDFVQSSAQCVFIPAGWQHLVVNLDFTIAITENFLEPRYFRKAWINCVNEREDFLLKWKDYLTTEQAQIAQKETPNLWIR